MSQGAPLPTELAPLSAPAPAEVALSPAADGAEAGAAEEPEALRWRKNVLLFAATVVSVLHAGLLWADRYPTEEGLLALLRALPAGYPFALPLLAILLTHEFGHYFAARIHRVRASLPFFIPLPFLSPFGTMGAVIAMPERIRSRAALLDIGAAGPLAGLAVALPVLAYGLSTSSVGPASGAGILEGQSLLYVAMKRIFVGPIPEGSDVFLNATAMAGWTGLLVTTLNLLPVYQLDGGHVAYALFGERQNRFGRLVHQGLLLVVAYNLAVFALPVVRAGAWEDLPRALGNSSSWLVWYVLLLFIRRAGDGSGDHPPTEPGPLSPARKVVAVVTLLFFVLLFMPTPWTVLV